MESKFHLLSVGQHFQWEGQSYVKSSPLIATQVPEGGQKFMPRAALVKVLSAEGSTETLSESPATLDSTTVRNAINHYHQRCMQLSKACANQEDGVEQLQRKLEQIYRELLLELKL